jgi:two-component system, sensor histidine kinase and response regulator
MRLWHRSEQATAGECPGKYTVKIFYLILAVWLGISLTQSGWADTSPRTPYAVDLTSEEKAWLATHVEVRLGADPSWPPFEMIENDGRYSGIASDYVSLLGERLGMRMKPVRDLDWAEIIEGAKARRIDVLPCLAKTPERSQFLNFTKPYLSFPVVIATRQDFPFVSGVQDFKPGKVAVIEARATQVWLNRDYPNMDFVLVGDSEEGLKALSEGKVDAFVDNIAAITYGTQKVGLINLRVATSTPYQDELAFGIRKDWPELASIIDKTLANLSETEKTTINNRWIMARVERELNWQLLLKIFLPILGGGGLLLAFFVRWNRTLAREVFERKASEERLQRSEERINLILHSVGEGIFGVDGKGRVSFVNEAAQQMLGYTPEEMVGQPVHALIHHSLKDGSHYTVEDCPMYASYTSAAENHVTDEVLWRKDGSSFDVDYTSVPMRKGDAIIGAVVVFRDITERKKAEAELKEYVADLERFNRLVIGREERMIELKEEVNGLTEKLGGEKKYKIVK